MPTTSPFNRYSAISSSSASSTSSTQHCHNPPNSSLSQSSTFLPLRSAASSLHLPHFSSTDYRSMQSLKIPQVYFRQRANPAPIARISPRVVNQPSSSLVSKQQSTDLTQTDQHWLSCEELETIEKRFTDLLQETNNKKTVDYRAHEQRAKSCDRLAIDKWDAGKPTTLTNPRQMEERRIDDRRTCSPAIVNDQPQSRSRTPHPAALLSANDMLKVEASYRSIGSHVFVARSLCELYITTADRLAKLEDWILFQQGLPVWLLNSGAHPKRPQRLSLLIAEHGSGFPIWEDTISGCSDVKQARAQHITFRLSDQITLAVLRFKDLSAAKEFFGSYLSIRNDRRYQQMFSSKTSHGQHNRSSSCGSMLAKRRKSARPTSKSSISNPCQFQHITSLQVHDRLRLTSLEQCLMPFHGASNDLL